ncbi:hypothetical protein TrispH2_012227, partial [Trichoplax sp. H2]
TQILLDSNGPEPLDADEYFEPVIQAERNEIPTVIERSDDKKLDDTEMEAEDNHYEAVDSNNNASPVSIMNILQSLENDLPSESYNINLCPNNEIIASIASDCLDVSLDSLSVTQYSMTAFIDILVFVVMLV